MATRSSIIGALRLLGNTSDQCTTFESFTELLTAIANSLGVEITNQEFSNIVISSQQPGSADVDKIWWRLSNSGTFVGIYAYANNVWNQVFPAPQEIFWLYGNSDDPPAGYSFDLLEATVGTPTYTGLIAMALPAGPGPYVYYPAIYVGF